MRPAHGVIAGPNESAVPIDLVDLFPLPGFDLTLQPEASRLIPEGAGA